MAVDVSVVIPFFNSGADIETCLESMVGQTLPHDRFEVLLMDDGSTDGTDARVEQWVARFPDLLSLHRLAASGGPARPRNVGIGKAQGRYVQFVDSDDTIALDALERLVAVADSSHADIVVHKISAGGPRNVFHQLFRQDASRLTLDDCVTLLRNGTVCKMFRRDFLNHHGIRFPEGPTHMEDQYLCLRAYANATSIALVSHFVSYFHWERRTGRAHFGNSRVDPINYRNEIEALLDVVDREVTSEATKYEARWRYYRGELLGPLRGRGMADYDDAYLHALAREMREVATTKFPPEIHDGMPVLVRSQSRLLLDGDDARLATYGANLDQLRLLTKATDVRWEDGLLVVGIEGRFEFRENPLRFDRDGEHWLLPESFALSVPTADRRWTDVDDADLDLDLTLMSRTDSALWSSTAGLALEIDDSGQPWVRGEVRLDPRSVMGGVALTPGIWDLRLRASVGGLTRSSPVTADVVAPVIPRTWMHTAAPGVVTPYWNAQSGALSLDVGEWLHPLTDLIDHSGNTVPVIGVGGELAIAADRILGRDGGVSSVQVTLEPIGADLGAAVVDGELRLGSKGSVVFAPLGSLSPSSRYAIWLRIGPLGGPAPVKLPTVVATDTAGAATVTAG